MTTTFTDPETWPLVVPLIAVGVTVATVREEPPKDTEAPAWKPVPFTVTDVPPAVEPLFGVTEVGAGGGGVTYVKQAVHVLLGDSGFVTATSTVPAAWVVVVPVMAVAVTVATVSAAPPKETVAPGRKSVPFTVTDVPPAMVPLFGVTDETVGGGGAVNVKQTMHVPVWVSGFVTTTFTAPVACAVVVPLIVVAVIVDPVTADPPNETVAPGWKAEPLTVTVVPPVADPLSGVTDETVGGGGVV